MRRIALISVGKPRSAHWQAAAQDYLARLRHVFRVEEIQVRDGDSRLPPDKRNAVEGKRVMAAVKPEYVPICLDENGRMTRSAEFAALLESLCREAGVPCFIIGGAYGLDASVLAQSRLRLSLGLMTFPHEMARVLLLEQLYRAESILSGRPYHHG